MGMFSLLTAGVTSALKSLPPFHGWTKVIYRCASKNTRSSLYEHVRQGYSHKPELDMTRVCNNTDEVIADLIRRKGDLRGEDVREIVSNLFVKSRLSGEGMREGMHSILQLLSVPPVLLQ